MGIFDNFFRKGVDPSKRLTKEEIIEQIVLAQHDLYVSNLPKPTIIDAEDNKKEVKEKFGKGIPRGFSINPKDWKTYVNQRDIPDFDTKDKIKEYLRSIGQHETSHFTYVPGSLRRYVKLMDSALKGFRHTHDYAPETLSAICNIVINIFGDWTGDTLLGRGEYGREDFSDLTIRRMRKTIEKVVKTTNDYSPLWKVLIGTYEKLLDKDLGLSKITELTPQEEDVVNECVVIMGDDFRYRYTWPEKVNQLAGTLEDIIMQSSDKKGGKGKKSKDGSGGGGGFSLSKDVEEQLGKDATENRIKPEKKSGEEDQDKGKSIWDKFKKEEEKEAEEKSDGKEVPKQKLDPDVLEEIYNLNKDNPGNFAGTVGLFMPVSPDQSIRLMNRMRAREYLIKVRESKNKSAYGTPSSYTNWNPGEPLSGRGGLEMVPSILPYGKIIPGITTVKRKRDVADLPGHLQQIADLLLFIDSSGSLNWDPLNPVEEYRGGFDKVIIAAEAASQYAIEHGAKVAIVNFSGKGEYLDDPKTGQWGRVRQVSFTDFTNDLDEIEKAIMLYYGDGTIFPVETLKDLLKKNENRVVTCIFSDFDIHNNYDTEAEIKNHASPENPFYLFDISRYDNWGLASSLAEENGITRFKVESLDDLRHVVIGRLREDYRSRH